MASNALWKTLRVFNYNRCLPCNLNSLLFNRQTAQVQVTPKCVNSSANTYSDIVADEPTVQKKRKIFIPRITLFLDNNDMTVCTLEEAERLAKRRDLKLVKIVDLDTRSERPVYKLMKLQDFLEEEAKAKAEAKEAKDKTIKEDKTIAISSKIAEHDLHTKVKSILKIIRKRHGVRALISIDGNIDKAKQTREYVIENCKDIAKAVAKSDTSFHLKITLRPILENLNQDRNKKRNKKDEKDEKEEDEVMDV